MTCIAQIFPNFIILFRREGAGSDTGRIGFDDAHDIFHAARADTRACAGTASCRIGAGAERVRAMIDIEHRCLGTFKQHFFAFIDIYVGRIVCIFYIGTDAFGISKVFLINRIEVKTLAAIIGFKKAVLQFQIDTQFFCKDILVHQIADADADTIDLISIAGADTIFRRADFGISLELFIFFIDADMVRHNHMGPRGNFQLADLDSLFFHAIQFLEENFRVYYDATADDARLIREQDP